SDARTDHAAGGPSTPEPQDQGNAQGRSEYRGQPGPEAVRGGGSEVPHPVAQPSYEPVGQGHTDTQGAQDPGDQGRGRASRRPPEDLAHAPDPLSCSAAQVLRGPEQASRTGISNGTRKGF